MSTETVQNAGQSDAAALAPSDDQDFDAAMAAAISDLDGTPADDVAVTGWEGDQQQSADDNPAPAPDAAADTPSADSNASPQGSANDDIWATAPAELREAFEKQQRDWDLRLRSANGRVSAFQRQLAQVQQQPTQQPAQQQEPNQQQEPQAQAPAKSGIDLTDPKYQQMREDFPEVAGPLLDLVESLASRLDQVGKTAGAFEQQQTSQFLATQEQALAEAHPDWQAAATDDRFTGWLQTQPTAIQEAFARNHNAIVDGKDAALVIGMFKQAVGFGAQQQPTPTPAPSQDPRRQRQLASGRDAGRTGPAAASGIADNDFESHMDAAIAKLERQL
jgi:hypothetical protein